MSIFEWIEFLISKLYNEISISRRRFYIWRKKKTNGENFKRSGSVLNELLIGYLFNIPHFY